MTADVIDLASRRTPPRSPLIEGQRAALRMVIESKSLTDAQIETLFDVVMAALKRKESPAS